jgi:hypothetical protein
VAGGYAETLSAGGELGVGYEIVTTDGHRRHRSLADAYPPDRLRIAEARLRALPHAWLAWAPRR